MNSRSITSRTIVLPVELTVYAAPMTSPDGRPAIALALCYAGERAEGDRASTLRRT